MNAALLTAEHDQRNPIVQTYNYTETDMLESGYLLHRFTKTHPVNLGRNGYWILGNTHIY